MRFLGTATSGKRTPFSGKIFLILVSLGFSVFSTSTAFADGPAGLIRNAQNIPEQKTVEDIDAEELPEVTESFSSPSLDFALGRGESGLYFSLGEAF